MYYEILWLFHGGTIYNANLMYFASILMTLSQKILPQGSIDVWQRLFLLKNRKERAGCHYLRYILHIGFYTHKQYVYFIS